MAHTLHEQQKTHCVLASALEIDDVSIACREYELVTCMSTLIDILLVTYTYISSMHSLYNIYVQHTPSS